MSLSQIRLELARTPEFPQGSPNHGYEFIAPLSKNAHIDAEQWKNTEERCRVVRFWGTDKPERGLLRHVGRGWRFDYDLSSDTDDEPFFKLDQHQLKTGAYVSVTEKDGVQRPFRVVSVTTLSK